ncbi:MAG TPA: molybdopterin-dependent oxidoreductase [Xanthobacteraceae bacterium]|nr:molybdopterin-dependent oxidoreductase [Xanthobacteraceae bacterium]
MNAHVDQPARVRTACPYCGVGCGIVATPDSGGGVAIIGDPMHPANFGALCSKGAALGETLGREGRLLHPMLRRNGKLARADWPSALGRVADGFSRIVARHGPDAVAFYLSGQLLTEDYYVANKMMKGFIGSANVDTNSRLCMSSSVAGHRRAFGADTVPGTYGDLDEADLIVLIGSNAAWCHPVLFQRMIANKRERGARLVVVDPRRTVTAEAADLFLPIAPGTDTALFCGLLAHLAEAGALDDAYIGNHTTGFAEAVARARGIAPDAAATARATGLALADVVAFFGAFRATTHTVTCYSQGVNQSAQGTDKVNAIINCHLATGRIGKPGMGPFSLTGQPNAMGGREVGGLANQLAAHMGFAPAEVDRVRRFWQAPRMATREGLKAVEMFEAIADGRIKALWVMATNPAVSLPRAGAVRDALARLELFVVSETVRSNDTVEAGAHVLLPAAAWGEKDGTVTNSERRITRQRAFMAAPGEARPDWKIVAQVARRMGFGQAFAYRSPADVFREHAALSAFENKGRRDFDLGGLADVSDAGYAALEPTQWPLRADGKRRPRRFFAEGGFFTPDRKARFVAPEPPALREATSNAFPFRLNTGRLRDQWHTMTRSGQSPRLALHSPEPCVAVNPADARAAGLEAGGFARVTTRHGAVVLKVALDEGQQPGSVFAPIHWSDATASSARIGDLVAPETDPHSGQPEAKATPAAIAPVHFATRGFALARRPLAWPAATWWARVAVAGGTGYLLASNEDVRAWQAAARLLLAGGVEPVEFAEYIDAPRGRYRIAAFAQDRLEACLFVGPAEAAPHWNAVKRLLASDAVGVAQRRTLLSGQSADGLADAGPVICSCFGVGLNVIRGALSAGKASSVEEIGRALRAGTNCGSCLPELKRIVQGAAPASVQGPVQGSMNERVAV